MASRAFELEQTVGWSSCHSEEWVSKFQGAGRKAALLHCNALAGGRAAQLVASAAQAASAARWFACPPTRMLTLWTPQKSPTPLPTGAS